MGGFSIHINKHLWFAAHKDRLTNKTDHKKEPCILWLLIYFPAQLCVIILSH